MFFLIPLALSALTTGYGVFQQVQANNRLAQQGADQADRQQQENLVTQLAEDAAFRRALSAANLAATQAQQQEAKAVKLQSGVLYAVAVSLVLLTIWMLVKRPQGFHAKPVLAMNR